MTINKIEHDVPNRPRKATITLDVKEIMYINNALYLAVQTLENPSSSMLEIKRDIYLLFELVENGCLDSAAVGILGEHQVKINEMEKNQ